MILKDPFELMPPYRRFDTHGITFFSAATAGFGAAAGAIGAALLKTTGYATVGVLQATKAGALGGYFTTTPLDLIIAGYNHLKHNERSIGNDIIAWRIFNLLLGAASGTIGYAILTANDCENEMGAGQFAVASGIGAALVSTGMEFFK